MSGATQNSSVVEDPSELSSDSPCNVSPPPSLKLSQMVIQEEVATAPTLNHTALVSSTIVEATTLPISSPNNCNTTSFTLFPKLPLELRQKIWSLAVSTPRTWNFPHFQTISRPTSFTSLMGTCRESRQIALEFYELTPKNTSYTFVRNTIYVLRGNPLNRNSSRPEVGDVLRRVGFEDRVARMMKHLRLGMEFGKNDCRSRTPHGHAFGAY